MKEFDQMKQKILTEYKRLNVDTPFQFRCHPGVSCFNDCCGDVNIFLTPYDIIRLKNHLGMTSGEFIDRHTVIPFTKEAKYPVILLRMGDDEKKQCEFNTPEGCGVYEDRPWACRMYPLGVASPAEDSEDLEEEFYFLLNDSFCKGHCEKHTQSIADYKRNQGVKEYDDQGEMYKALTTHRFFREGNQLTPQKMDMFFMVCYDIDMFRSFVFKSSFLDKFIVDDQTLEAIKTDDLALLRLGYRWLHFALFAEQTMTVKTDVLQEKERVLNIEQKRSARG
jgi:hypothetical protein